MKITVFLLLIFSLLSCNFPFWEEESDISSVRDSYPFDTVSLYNLADSDPVTTGNTYYIDPVNGSIDNDGSIDSPWSSLEEVIGANYIEYYVYNELPYVEGAEKRVKNEGAPVKGGDRLILLSGDHGAMEVRGFYFNDYLTIEAEEGHTPYLSVLDLSAVSHLYIKGLTIKREVGDVLPREYIYIETHGWHGESSYVTIDSCVITTEGDWESWSADDWISNTTNGIRSEGEWVVIKNNLLESVSFGIIAGKNNLIQNNTINRFRGDGLRGCEDNIIFENNRVLDAYDVDANHDDCFQSFITDDNPVVNNIILRGNYFQTTTLDHSGKKDSDLEELISTAHGIGAFDGPYEGWIIEDNIIALDHLHGITLLGAHNSVIQDNIVVPLYYPENYNLLASIRLSDSKDKELPYNSSIINNISTGYSYETTVTTDGNITITTREELESLFIDYDMLDFNLK